MLKNKNSLLSVFTCAFLGLSISVTAGCKKQEITYGQSRTDNRIVIWTDNSEFAPYIEYFNKTHQNKAVLIYKENPASALSSNQSDIQPDLVIGSWLVNEQTKKYFEPLDYLFERKFISSQDFYEVLLQVGKFSKRQYILPVSFNLPAIIFSRTNESYLEDNYTISLEQLKRSGEAYNKKNKNGTFNTMGFAPESNDNFLYLVTKIQGANYREIKGNYFTWEPSALLESIKFLENWINEANGSSQIERDFVYKYLSVNDDKRVTQGKTLFAYTTSDKLFKLSKQQLSKIDYRWLQNEKKLPVEDSMLMMGIPKQTENHYGAAEFISWFYNPETQQKLLERKFEMNLDTNKFGIANGFSAIRDVNEHILPVFYTTLLSNIPQADSFKVYDKKPLRWERIKQKVIIPYNKDSLTSNGTKKVLSIDERYSEWRKQGFN